MGTRAITWALQIPASTDVGNAALRTLEALALHANTARGFEAWPKIATLARERATSRATIKRHLHQLENAGLIAHSTQELPPTLARTQPRHRPVVWRLAVPADDGSQGEPSREGSQDDADDGSQGDLDEVLPGEPSIGTRRELEGKVQVAVSSEAWADLGGGSPPPARPYPKQCLNHQRGEHSNPCAGCRDARAAFDEQQVAQRRERRIEESKRRNAEKWGAIQKCELCDGRGRLPGMAVCQHEAPAPDGLGSALVEEYRKLRNGQKRDAA